LTCSSASELLLAEPPGRIVPEKLIFQLSLPKSAVRLPSEMVPSVRLRSKPPLIVAVVATPLTMPGAVLLSV